MKKEKLKELKEKIENIGITYEIESVYCDLRNATIDYQNDTQDWDFDELFEEYIDDWLLQDMVQYKLKNEGIWSIKNLLSDIDDETGVYKVDCYGYGYSVDTDELEELKNNILDLINDKLKEEE